MDDYELYHYGVKGMKWGVIRWKDKLGYGRLNKKFSKYESKIDKQLSKKHINQKKLKKYRYKKNQIQKAMNLKYSDLTPEEKKQGARAYSRVMSIAKGLGIFGLGVGIGALTQNIVDNGGIRKEFKYDNNDVRLNGYSGHSGTEVGDEVATAVQGQDALVIGKLVIPLGESYTRRGSSTVSSVGDYGQATGFKNFKSR